MTIKADVILDSISPVGIRLVTLEITYPRFIHSELMTHRVFSRNAASSRAIPTKTKLERIRKDPAKPSEWGVNQKGMQSAGPIDKETAEKAEAIWLKAMKSATDAAEELDKLGLHKQVPNRIPEPFDHITVVLSGTKFGNHKKLRTEVDENGRPLADPTYYELASKMEKALAGSKPRKLDYGEWHLPYLDDATITEMWGIAGQLPAADTNAIFLELARKVSVGRCARVSYMRQGKGDIEDNVKLHDALSKNGHWSPFEHVATPIERVRSEIADSADYCHGCEMSYDGGTRVVIVGSKRLCAKCGYGHIHSGNFYGWHQYRKDFPNEAGGD